MALGLTDEAQTAAAILGHNYPDSPWYQDAYKLLQTGGLQPRLRIVATSGPRANVPVNGGALRACARSTSLVSYLIETCG